MKKQFYIYLILSTLFLTSCKSRGQKPVISKENDSPKQEKIIDYINTKSVTSYYNEKKIVIGSSFDSTNTLGVFEILYYDNEKDITKLYKNKNTLHSKNEVLNKYKKTAFFFKKEHLDKVPMKHIEGLAVGWEYDIKPPCPVFVFSLKKGEWRFLESIYINSHDDYENITNLKIENLIGNRSFFQKKWKGSFSFSLEDLTRMGETHSIYFDFDISDINNPKIISQLDEEKKKIRNCQVTHITKDTLVLMDKQKNDDIFILSKQGNNYNISGSPIYILNPPNESYPLTKE
ncbi:hypothetical protein [Aquimarina muelleri]|uniref:hypothetical protein n=1 Tax=Aquimarina muelleri TaxID=279356 RepID=UPI00040D2AF5|nr:hypothetical protein [Aquimarina muelleri]